MPKLRCHCLPLIAFHLVFQDEPQPWLERVLNYINHRFQFGNFSISLTSLAIGIAILLLALVVSRYLRAFIDARLVAKAQLDPGLKYTLLRLTHYIIIAVGVLWAFSTAFNADLYSLAIIFTALSVGIGFGLQYIAGDIASGFILLFERPVRVGDFITVGQEGTNTVEGRVESINLRTTVVITNDRIAVIVPNSRLVNQQLINWSYGDPRTRISVTVGVSYDADVDHVTRTLLRAVEDIKYTIPEPPPSVQFLGFGDSSLNFRLMVWTNRPRRYPYIKSEVNYRIRKLLQEEGIEIPFPQRDIHFRGGEVQIKQRLSDGDKPAPQTSSSARHGLELEET